MPTDDDVIQDQTDKNQSDEEKIEEEPFDKERAMATITKLRGFEKQAKLLEKKLQEYEKAEAERKKGELSELERLKQELDAEKLKAAALERAMLQRQIAEKIGLPLQLAERLMGESPEDLEADAKKLLELLPKKSPPKLETSNPDGSKTSGADETIEQRRKRLLG